MTQGISTRSIPEYVRVEGLDYYPLMWEADYNSQVFASTTPVAPATAAQNSTNNLITRVGYNITNHANNRDCRNYG